MPPNPVWRNVRLRFSDLTYTFRIWTQLNSGKESHETNLETICRLIAFVLTAALLLSGCDTGTKQYVGTVLGAGIGAVTGSTIGDGRGQLLGIAAGTLVGSLLGREIGKSLGRADLAYFAQTSNRRWRPHPLAPKALGMSRTAATLEASSPNPQCAS